jgi:hypothetical protein
MAVEVDQIELMQQMNRALNLQVEALNTITQRLGGQSAAYKDMTSAAGAATDKIDAQTESTSGLDRAWKGLTESLTSWIPDSVKNGFSLLTTNIMSLLGVMSDGQASIQGFFNTVYNTIIKKAAELAIASVAYAEALENVRDKFGDLNEDTSRQVVSSAQSLSSGLADAAGDGGAFAGKFGIGIDAGIAKLQKMTEIVADLGPTFNALGEEGFANASRELYVLKDGLAFTGEGLQATARLAMISGESVQSFGQHIMASVDKIGKHFGMSTKVLGGDVGKALGNFKMLGKMTGDYVKEITKAAVFTRKLGIEITTLTGLVDKFDDFESGAEAAAQLAQGFGLVVDPLKMMGMEVGPRLAELQKGFIATGRSIDSMSRQERALLASTSGLSDEQVQLAFSQKGLSMSYDDISKGANEAAEKQKSSQEVMVDLAKNIKNIIQPMITFTGFVEAFFAGIQKGFGTSKGFLALIGTLAKQLTEVYEIGGQVGRILSDALFSDADANGRGGMLGYITNIGDMFVTIAKHVKYFIKALVDGEDVSTTVSNFFSNIFGVVSGTFEKSVSGFSVGALASKFGTKIIEVFTGAIKFFVKQIPLWSAGLKGMFTGVAGAGASGGLMAPIFTALGDLTAELPKLLPVLKDFAGELVKMLFRFVQEYPFGTMLGALFLAGGPIATVIADFLSNIPALFGKLFGKSAETISTTSMSAGNAAAKTTADAIANGALSPMTEAVAKESTSWLDRVFDIVKDPAKIVALAAGIGAAIVTIGAAIQTVLMSFMEVQPGKTKSFVETVRDAANLFTYVDGSALISLGVVMGSVFAGVAAVTAAVAAGASKLGVSGTLAVVIAGFGAAGMFSKALGAITTAVSDIATNFGNSSFITNLNKVVGLKDQLSSLGNVAESIEKVMSGIVAISAIMDGGYLGFALNIKDLNDTIRNAVELIAGNAEIGGIVFYLKNLPDMTELVGKDAGMASITSIVGSIAGVVKSLTEMPDASGANEKINSLTTYGGTPFINNLGNLINVQLLQFKDIKVPDTVFKSIKTVIDDVGSIVTTLTGLPDIDLATRKLYLLRASKSGDDGFIISLSRFFKDQLAPFKGLVIPENLSNIKPVIADIALIVTALSGIVAGTITTANTSLSDMVTSGFLTNLDTVLSELGLTSFNMGADTLINQLTQQKAVIDSINPLIMALGNVEAVTNAIISAGLLAAFFPAFKFTMTNATDALSTLPALTPEQSSAAVFAIDDMFNVIKSYTAGFDSVAEYLSDEKLSAFELRITALQAHVGKVRDILANIGEIDIQGTVNDMQKGMKVAKSVMTINGGAVVVSVNMTVNMNAEKMAAALVMGGYLEASPEFGPYLLEKDGVGDTFEAATKDYYYGGERGDKAPAKP